MTFIGEDETRGVQLVVGCFFLFVCLLYLLVVFGTYVFRQATHRRTA